MRGPDLHLNWLQTSTVYFCFRQAQALTSKCPRPLFDSINLLETIKARSPRNGGACMTDRVIFLLLLEWRLGFSSLGWRLRKTSCPWHLIHHSGGEKREMTGPSDVERKREEKTSAIWFGRRRAEQPAAQNSLCMQSPVPLWIIATCARSVSKEMIRAEGGLAEWSHSPCSPAWKAYLQKWCTTCQESIYLICVNLLIMNLCLSSLLRHLLSWELDAEQQHSQGLSVSGGKHKFRV